MAACSELSEGYTYSTDSQIEKDAGVAIVGMTHRRVRFRTSPRVHSVHLVTRGRAYLYESVSAT